MLMKCKDCNGLGTDFSTGICGIPICKQLNKYIMDIDDTPINCPMRGKYDSELPNWVIDKITEAKIDCQLQIKKLQDAGDLEESTKIAQHIFILDWVLSLKPGDA